MTFQIMRPVAFCQFLGKKSLQANICLILQLIRLNERVHNSVANEMCAKSVSRMISIFRKEGYIYARKAGITKMV
jgi:ribosomal protein S8